MAEKTMMRVPKELLKEIEKCKIANRESYADVVKRIIEKERKLKKWKGGKAQMGKIDDLKKELKAIQDKANEEKEILNLQRQIKSAKFGQTKTGKVLDAFGKVGKAIFSEPKHNPNAPKRKSVQDIIKGLPQ